MDARPDILDTSRDIRKKLFRMFLFSALICLALAAVTPAGATENGGGAYPNGAEDFMSGAVPPPGNYFINYVDYYSANKFKGGPPDFKLNVAADTLRFIHITDKQILGGYWGFHVFLPFVYMDVTAVGKTDRRGSLGDIIVDPFILSWHGKNWHAATGVDIYVPTGNYRYVIMPRANIGRNYWTFEPIIAGTYICPGGYEVSGKFMYDFNTKNTTTDYLSGQEFHFDYAIGKKIGDFNVGAAGYFYQQVTNDKQFGNRVPFNNGNKGRVVAFGPAAKYDYKNMSFSAKYLFETLVENRPIGGNMWLKFVYAF
jgi:hypothetical protein